MKKLALASVAFAGITAFGAGDSFATGFVGFTSMTGFSSTDSTVWAPLGASSPGSGPGGTAGLTAVSNINHIGVTVSLGASTNSTPSLSILNIHCPAGSTANAACGGFPTGTHVLAGFSSSGGMNLVFNKPLSAIGFEVSPLFFADWGATATFYTGPSTNLVLLGSVKLSGLPNCFGTGSADCKVAAFVGATDTTTPITDADISLASSGPYAIGPLSERLFSKSAIPEPTTLSLLGAGLFGLGALRRRRRAGDPAEGSRWSSFGRWRVAGHPPDSKHRLR
jgi:hypothetical protein